MGAGGYSVREPMSQSARQGQYPRHHFKKTPLGDCRRKASHLDASSWPYGNCLPVHAPVVQEGPAANLTPVERVGSELDRLLAEVRWMPGPCSGIEYAPHAGRHRLLPDGASAPGQGFRRSGAQGGLVSRRRYSADYWTPAQSLRADEQVPTTISRPRHR